MYLLFDIGGTKMRVATSKDGINIHDPKVIPTPKNFEAGMKMFRELAQELSEGEKIVAAAGGIAGPFNRGKSVLVNSPHLPNWCNEPLKEEIEKIIKAPAYLENDTAIVGLGEAVNGTGRGYGIVVYITISTGVNGVRVVDGMIDKNTFGFEIGHQIINVDGPPGNNVGYLEDFVSGTAVERQYGRHPSQIHEREVWDEVASWLAIGLNNVIVHWSPEIIVLGGGMVIKSPGVEIEDVERHVKKTVTIFPELPEIKKASCGDFGGLHGALAHLKSKL